MGSLTGWCLCLKLLIGSNQHVLQVTNGPSQGGVEGVLSLHPSLLALMCYVLKGLCEFSLSPSSFSVFSSPPPFGVFSLVPWLGRYKEIGGIYSLHWNSFSTQNDFLVFILWWGDSCSTVMAPQSLSDEDGFFLFALEMPSIPTLYQPRMLKGKKMWQTGQLEILPHTLTSWL